MTTFRVLTGIAVVALAGVMPAAAQTGSGTISTVAGTGTSGYSGDGGPATSAQFSHTTGVTAVPNGGFLVADQDNHRVRYVAPDGIISTVAGSGTPGFSGDGGPATLAQLDLPTDVAMMPDGSFLISEFGNNRIRRVAADGTITTVAGNGSAPYSGDGGPATAAGMSAPTGVAGAPDGGFFFSDFGNFRVRRVAPDGTITTVAGTGSPGFSGDGGPSTAAQVNATEELAATSDGGVVFADRDNHRIRYVSPGGTITTIAGTGVPGYSGDGGEATAAQLDTPQAVDTLDDGSILIADTNNNRIRRLSGGIITTVAGNGSGGSSGDGGPATSAATSAPISVAGRGGGGFLFTEAAPRVRAVTPAGTDEPAPGALPAPVRGVSVNAVPERGIVRIRDPQTGRFRQLAVGEQIPVGSVLDTRRGTVGIRAAGTTAGKTQKASFRQGVFRIRQPRRRKAFTDLALTGKLVGCARASGHATASRRRGRRLWGRGNGRFRSIGTRASAGVRGTEWLVEDRCDGSTLVRVKSGRVTVRDLVRQKTLVLTTGQQYVSRRRPR